MNNHKKLFALLNAFFILTLQGCSSSLNPEQQISYVKTREELIENLENINADLAEVDKTSTSLKVGNSNTIINNSLLLKKYLELKVKTLDEKATNFDNDSIKKEVEELNQQSNEINENFSYKTLEKTTDDLDNLLEVLNILKQEKGFLIYMDENKKIFSQYENLIKLKGELSSKYANRKNDFEKLAENLSSKYSTFKSLVDSSINLTTLEDQNNLLLKLFEYEDFKTELKNVNSQLINFERGYEEIVSSVSFNNAQLSLDGVTWECSDYSESCSSESETNLTTQTKEMLFIDDLIIANILDNFEEVISKDENTFNFESIDSEPKTSSEEIEEFVKRFGFDYESELSNYASFSFDLNDDIEYKVTLSKIDSLGNKIDEIIDVNYEDFIQYSQNLNMAIRHKLPGQLESEATDKPVPAGSSFIGNPQSGNFVNNVWVYNRPTYSTIIFDSYDTGYYTSYRGRNTSVDYRPSGFGNQSPRWQSKFSTTTSGKKGFANSSKLNKTTIISSPDSGFSSRGKGPGGSGK